MPEDHPRGVVLDLAQGDETTAFVLCYCAQRGKTLRIGIDRRLRILQEYALSPPVPKVAGSAGIDVVAVAAGLALSQNDAHEVVGTGRVVAFLHLRSNLVVGLCDHLRNIDPARVITQGAKRCKVSHDFEKRRIITRSASHLPCLAHSARNASFCLFCRKVSQ